MIMAEIVVVLGATGLQREINLSRWWRYERELLALFRDGDVGIYREGL